MKPRSFLYLLISLLITGIPAYGQSDTVYISETDTALRCNVDSLYLMAMDGCLSYEWNTGEATKGIWAYDNGIYDVICETSPSEFSYDTVYINMIQAKIKENDTAICFGDTINLSADRKRSDCLVAYYSFNGNAEDGSGNDYHAFPIGARLVADRFGNPKSAYTFDGQNDYMIATIGDYSSSSLAVSLWFRVPDTSNWYDDNWYPCIFDYANEQLSAGINGLAPEYLDAENVGNISFSHKAGEGPGNDFRIESPDHPEFAEWHHLYVAFDSETYAHQVYVDGTLAATQIHEAILQAVQDSLLFIGKSSTPSSGGSTYFLGRIDEISIYNCLLSPEEVKAVYQSGSVYNYQYYWSTGDTVPSIAKVPAESTKYYFGITDGINSCVDSVFIEVYPEIVLELEQLDMGCPGEEKAIMLADVTEGDEPFEIEWDERIRFLQGDTLALGLKDSIDYELNITDAHGCVLENEFTVEAKPLPDVSFTFEPEEIYIQNPIVQFISETEDVESWLWTFGDGLQSTEENPEHVFGTVDSYEIKLEVIGSNACVDSVFGTVDIQEVELDIANVFTPNGDGVNDNFVIPDLDKYISNEFVVFNRYGKKVFSKNNYQSGDWDGGNLRPGTYFYVLKCQGYFSNDEFKGAITIVK